jgi:hypothetical protein
VLCGAQSSASVGVNITMPSIALLDIEPNTTGFNLGLTAPTEAGNTITTISTNSSKWINFTSAVTAGATKRVSIRLSGTIPNGVNLVLTTSSYSGTGAGSLGTRVSPLTLSTNEQILINSIGGAFTGNGIDNGYNLNYTLQVTNFSLLRSQSSTLSVVFTLIDN